MKRRFRGMQYVDTYRIVDLLHAMVTDPEPYAYEFDGCWGDAAAATLLEPFPRHSRLHQLADQVSHQVLFEEVDDVTVDSLVQNPTEKLWVETALARHHIVHTPFASWLARRGTARDKLEPECIHQYFENLERDGAYPELRRQMADEAFSLLFLNRSFLRQLNVLLADRLAAATTTELGPNSRKRLSRSRTLRRVPVPDWARRAVFYRDRGMCVFCHADLSGALSTMSEKNFDHIVALARGGLNDVTNLQLACGRCNRRKAAGVPSTSDEYEAWY